MALTDIFVTQYLLQGSEAAVDTIGWRELESGGYEASVNGVTVQIDQCHDRAGAYVCLTVHSEVEKVFITEPRSNSIIGRKYKSDDDRTLAELVRKLHKVVEAQCAERRRRSEQRMDEIKQEIFHRLVFGQEARVR